MKNEEDDPIATFAINGSLAAGQEMPPVTVMSATAVILTRIINWCYRP